MRTAFASGPCDRFASIALWGISCCLLLTAHAGGMPPEPKCAEAHYRPPTAATQGMLQAAKTQANPVNVNVQPPVLVFKDTPICIPTVALIDVVNNFADRSVRLLGITAQHPQFYPAMFQPQELRPLGMSTIQIIFLPRAVGYIETTLTISTSEGDIAYGVQANPVLNIYRLAPIIQSRVPAGVSNIRPIVLYNPHNEVLHVREVFTTESFINIIVPEDAASSPSPCPTTCEGADCGAASAEGGCSGGGNTSVWAVPAKEEREIVKLAFRGTKPGLYHGYIHLKTDVEAMVVPIDLTVVRGGVYAEPRDIDFGTLTKPDERREISVALYNSASEPLAVLDVTPSMPDCLLSITTHHDPQQPTLVLPPGQERQGALTLAYSGRTAGRVNGKVVVMTNHSNAGLAAVEIGYHALVLHGDVLHQGPPIAFFLPSNFTTSTAPANTSSKASVGGKKASGKGKKTASTTKAAAPPPPAAPAAASEPPPPPPQNWTVVTQSLRFSNGFSVRLSLERAEMRDCVDALRVTHFPKSAVAEPDAPWPNLTLSFLPGVASRHYHPLPHVCSLSLWTNASQHILPVYIHNGRLLPGLSKDTICFMGPHGLGHPLQVQPAALSSSSSPPSRPEQRLTLDLGAVGLGQKRNLLLTLANLNPLPLSITGIIPPSSSNDSLRLTLSYGYMSQSPSPYRPAPQWDVLSEATVPRPPLSAHWEEVERQAAATAAGKATSSEEQGQPTPTGSASEAKDKASADDDASSKGGGGKGKKKRKKKKGSKKQRQQNKAPPRPVKHVRLVKTLTPEAVRARQVKDRAATPTRTPGSEPRKLRFRVASRYASRGGSLPPPEQPLSASVLASSPPPPVVPEPRPVVVVQQQVVAEEVVMANVSATAPSLSGPWLINPLHTALYHLTVETPQIIEGEEEQMQVQGLTLRTPYEDLSIAVKAHVVAGELALLDSSGGSSVSLGDCFPGMQASQPLYAANSMPQPVDLTALAVSHPWFSVQLSERTLPARSQGVLVGHVSLDLAAQCRGQAMWPCLHSLVSSRLERRGTRGRSIIANASAAVAARAASIRLTFGELAGDMLAHEWLKHAWPATEAAGLHRLRASVRLESKVQSAGGLKVHAALGLPRLASSYFGHGGGGHNNVSAAFPATHVGETTPTYLTVANPLPDRPVEARLVILYHWDVNKLAPPANLQQQQQPGAALAAAPLAQWPSTTPGWWEMVQQQQNKQQPVSEAQPAAASQSSSGVHERQRPLLVPTAASSAGVALQANMQDLVVHMQAQHIAAAAAAMAAAGSSSSSGGGSSSPADTGSIRRSIQQWLSGGSQGGVGQLGVVEPVAGQSFHAGKSTVALPVPLGQADGAQEGAAGSEGKKEAAALSSASPPALPSPAGADEQQPQQHEDWIMVCPADDEACWQQPTPFRVRTTGLQSVVLEPGGKAQLGPIHFRPTTSRNYSTELYVWSNLTGLEPVSVAARGGQASLRIETPEGIYLGGTSPEKAADEEEGEERGIISGVSGRLTFDVQKPLELYQGGGGGGEQALDVLLAPSVRMVRLKNEGTMPLEVTHFRVPGAAQSCGGEAAAASGRKRRTGFFTDVCDVLPLWLAPSSSLELPVSYVTPCLASQQVSSLEVRTSAGQGSASLIAYVSSDLLAECERLSGQAALASQGRGWGLLRHLVASVAVLLVVVSVFDILVKAIELRRQVLALRAAHAAAPKTSPKTNINVQQPQPHSSSNTPRSSSGGSSSSKGFLSSFWTLSPRQSMAGSPAAMTPPPVEPAVASRPPCALPSLSTEPLLDDHDPALMGPAAAASPDSPTSLQSLGPSSSSSSSMSASSSAASTPANRSVSLDPQPPTWEDTEEEEGPLAVDRQSSASPLLSSPCSPSSASASSMSSSGSSSSSRSSGKKGRRKAGALRPASPGQELLGSPHANVAPPAAASHRSHVVKAGKGDDRYGPLSPSSSSSSCASSGDRSPVSLPLESESTPEHACCTLGGGKHDDEQHDDGLLLQLLAGSSAPITISRAAPRGADPPLAHVTDSLGKAPPGMQPRPAPPSLHIPISTRRKVASLTAPSSSSSSRGAPTSTPNSKPTPTILLQRSGGKGSSEQEQRKQPVSVGASERDSGSARGAAPSSSSSSSTSALLAAVASRPFVRPERGCPPGSISVSRGPASGSQATSSSDSGPSWQPMTQTIMTGLAGGGVGSAAGPRTAGSSSSAAFNSPADAGSKPDTPLGEVDELQYAGRPGAARAVLGPQHSPVLKATPTALLRSRDVPSPPPPSPALLHSPALCPISSSTPTSAVPRASSARATPSCRPVLDELDCPPLSPLSHSAPTMGGRLFSRQQQQSGGGLVPESPCSLPPCLSSPFGTPSFPSPLAACSPVPSHLSLPSSALSPEPWQQAAAPHQSVFFPRTFDDMLLPDDSSLSPLDSLHDAETAAAMVAAIVGGDSDDFGGAGLSSGHSPTRIPVAPACTSPLPVPRALGGRTTSSSSGTVTAVEAAFSSSSSSSSSWTLPLSSQPPGLASVSGLLNISSSSSATTMSGAHHGGGSSSSSSHSFYEPLSLFSSPFSASSSLFVAPPLLSSQAPPPPQRSVLRPTSNTGSPYSSPSLGPVSSSLEGRSPQLPPVGAGVGNQGAAAKAPIGRMGRPPPPGFESQDQRDAEGGEATSSSSNLSLFGGGTVSFPWET